MNTSISYASGKGSYINKYKPVILSAGNGDIAINYPTSTYAIIVGGSMPSTVPDRYIKWYGVNGSGLSYGSSYFNPNVSGLNLISLAASAQNIYFLGGNGLDHSDGTSLAAPMVAATMGMMRKANPNITFDQLRDLITYSANIEKSESGYGGTSTKLVGKELEVSFINPGQVAGVRNLNVLNAIVMAKNLPNYQVLTRLYNIDDDLYLGNSTNSTLFGQTNVENYGKDKVFGINGLSSGNYINFKEYNSSGGCAYGYQIYRRDYTSPLNFDRLGGVSGISGTNTGTCNSSAFNYTAQYFYN